jgi:hypothetical protein
MPRKTSGASKAVKGLPDDVAAMVSCLREFLNHEDPQTSRKPADAKCGIYAFFDFDGEPIYCGQTNEQLRVRIQRHLTNQRTDAVAMRVLDPLEVAEIEVWPFWEFEDFGSASRERRRTIQDELNRAEFTVYERLIDESRLKRILNEKRPADVGRTELPTSYRGTIVPPEIRARLSHPDLRIARRAQKLAELAGIIAQRDVSVGLRNTLITQAERLLMLSKSRYDQITTSDPAKARKESVELGDEEGEIPS